MNIPSFSTSEAVLSISVLVCIFCMKALTSASYSVPLTNSWTNSLSGANTIKVTPYVVSGLVV